MTDTIKLPRAGRAKRAHVATLETPLVRRILDAVNALDYANCWRNNSGALEDRTGRLVRYGLAVGSADIIGMVRIGVFMPGPRLNDEGTAMWTCASGRFLSIEVKVPGKTPTEDQQRWALIVRKMGGFACIVHSVDEALAAVERARDPRVLE